MKKKIFFRIYAVLLLCLALVVLRYNYTQNPVIEIEFHTTNYDEQLILFYDNGMENVFDDDHIKRYDITETEEFQKASFSVPKGSLGNLRIDIGSSSGSAEIKEIVIKKNLFWEKTLVGDEIIQYFPETNMITEYSAATYVQLKYDGNDAYIRSQNIENIVYELDILKCIATCVAVVLISLVLNVLICFGIKFLKSDFVKSLWGDNGKQVIVSEKATAKEKKTLIIALIICFISHMLMVTQLEGWLCADVEGYLSHAATFAGKDWSGVMRNAYYFYSWGYSVLLIIPMLFFSDIIAVHYAAVFLHALLCCGMLLMCYDLAKRILPDADRKNLIWASLAVSLYTTYIFQGAVMLSEIYLYFFVLVDIYLLYRYLESDKEIWGVLCGLAVGYTYIIHNRAIGVVIAYVLVAILIGASSRSWKKFLVLVLPMFIAMLFNQGVLQFLDEHEKQGMEYTSNTYARQVNNVKSKISIYGIVSILKCIVGECWYMLIGSFGMVAIGIYDCGKKIITEVKNKNREVFWYTFLALCLLGMLAVSALSVAPSRELAADARYDIYIYGRYWETVFGIFILLGFLRCIQGIKKGLYLAIIASGVLLTGITELITGTYKDNWCNFWGVPAVLTSFFDQENVFNVITSGIIGIIVIFTILTLILVNSKKCYKFVVAIWSITCVGFGSMAVHNAAETYINFSYAGSMPFYNEDFNGVCEYIREAEIEKFGICSLDAYWGIPFQMAFPDMEVLGVTSAEQKDEAYDIYVVDKKLWPVEEYTNPLYENDSYYIIKE